MKKLGDLMMILDLHRQGVKIAVIDRQVGIDRKTVHKYIARGLEPPSYGPRRPRPRRVDGYIDYLRARLEAYPGLSAQRLTREITERGYVGCYSCVRDAVRDLRPAGGGGAYRLRRHANLLPEHIRSTAMINPPAPNEPRRRGRPSGGAGPRTA